MPTRQSTARQRYNALLPHYRDLLASRGPRGRLTRAEARAHYLQRAIFDQLNLPAHERRAAENAAARRARMGPARPTRRTVARARRQNRNLAYNTEIKSQTFPICKGDLVKLQPNNADAQNGPKNSYLVLGGMHAFSPDGNIDGVDYLGSTGFQRGTGCDQIIGCWVTEAYNSIFKYRLKFDKLAAVQNAANTYIWPSIHVRIIHGLYMNTGAKLDAPMTDVQAFYQSIRTALKQELFQSSVSSDHLEFRARNRRIKILKDVKIKPEQSQLGNFQSVENQGNMAPFQSPCPPYEGSFSFPKAPLKQKLEDVTNPGTANRSAVPAHSWVPFTLFMCDELNVNSYIPIEWSSKFYIKDN